MKTDVGLVIFLLLVSPIYGFAQQEGFILSGRVLDAQSKEPVSIASLQNGRELILTNVKGEFKIQTSRGDRLLISHTAYQPKIYIVNGNETSVIEILLEEKLVDLFEVEVSPFPTEEAFKQEVMEAVPRYHYERSLMLRNQSMAKQIVPLGYDYSSYFKHVKSVNEISFISNNGALGLLKAIRDLKRKEFRSPPPSQRMRREIWYPQQLQPKGHWKHYFEPE
jgi:hypothetical protein